MKRLACCLDGTWNTDDVGSIVTNLVKLWWSIPPEAKGVPQLAHYVTRIEPAKDGRPAVPKWSFRNAVGPRIRDGYQFLAGKYEPGDEIYLFGFARGAFEARSLASFIALCGIARNGAPAGWIEEAWELYRQRPTKRDAAALERLRSAAHYPVRIRCIGVWDTVRPISDPLLSRLFGRGLGFHDTRLQPSIDKAFHALSIDERRGAFRPLLWTRSRDAAAPADQLVEQVWFAGSHADVGGGYAETGLSDVTLDWMMQRVSKETGLVFDANRLVDYTHKHLQKNFGVKFAVPKALRGGKRDAVAVVAPTVLPIRPDPLGPQHASATGALSMWSRLFPFVRLIQQHAEAIPDWRRALLGSWRAGKIAKGEVAVNESIHPGVAERFGKDVIELSGGHSLLITYEPANLGVLNPQTWKPKSEPAAPVRRAAAPGAKPRVKIFTVHGTFADEADWDDWDTKDEKKKKEVEADRLKPRGFISRLSERLFGVTEKRNFINRLSEHLASNGVILDKQDHTPYEWSGGNSHDERQIAAIGLKHLIQDELEQTYELHGKDYYDGGVYVIGHSHGGTLSRIAMNLWDKDFYYYPPMLMDETLRRHLERHDAFTLDDKCPTCKQERNGRVGPNTVQRPDTVITFGSPFVTFETRKSGLLTARIAVWVFRILAIIPMIALYFFMVKHQTPLHALNILLAAVPVLGTILTGEWVQALLLLAWPLAAYWLVILYLPRRLIWWTEKKFNTDLKTGYALEDNHPIYLAVKFAMHVLWLLGFIALAYYYVMFAGLLLAGSSNIAGKLPLLDNRYLHITAVVAVPLMLYWLVAIHFPSRFLSWIGKEVVQLKDGLPMKYDPREDRPVSYLCYTAPGDEAGLALRFSGYLTWLIQTLSLSAACLLAFGLLLAAFVGVEVLLQQFVQYTGGSVSSRLGFSARDGVPAHKDNLIGLMNLLTAYPRVAWSWAMPLLGYHQLDAMSLAPGSHKAVQALPEMILISIAGMMAVTIMLVAPVLLVSTWLNSRLRRSAVFGSENFTWTLANRIAVSRRANMDTELRSFFITPEAWSRGEKVHNYYYWSDRVTKNLADYLAGEKRVEPNRLMPYGNMLATAARWAVVLLFVLSIFAVAVVSARIQAGELPAISIPSFGLGSAKPPS